MAKRYFIFAVHIQFLMKILAHQQIGKGQEVVLIHGFCESQEMWHFFSPELAKYFKIISLDLGGFGESQDLLPEPCSIEHLAEQVKQLLQHLQVPKAIFVGHSLGAYVSLALAEKYPNLVEKIVLFHSTALADSPEKVHIRNKTIDFVKKVGVEAYIKTFVSPLFYAERLSELTESISFLENIGKKTPQNSIIKVIEAMRDRKNRLNIIKNASFPILYIIGKNDNAISFESYQEQINCNSQIKTFILEETGHMGMFERPQETLEALIQFCSL